MIRLLGASFFLPLNQGCSKQVSKLLSGPAQYSATAPTMRWKREAFKMRNLLNGWSCRKVMEAVVFFLCDCEWLRIKKRRRRCVACFFFPWGGGKVFSAGIFPLMHSEYRKFSKCRKRRRLEPRLDSWWFLHILGVVQSRCWCWALQAITIEAVRTVSCQPCISEAGANTASSVTAASSRLQILYAIMWLFWTTSKHYKWVSKAFSNHRLLALCQKRINYWWGANGFPITWGRTLWCEWWKSSCWHARGRGCIAGFVCLVCFCSVYATVNLCQRDRQVCWFRQTPFLLLSKWRDLRLEALRRASHMEIEVRTVVLCTSSKVMAIDLGCIHPQVFIAFKLL